MQRNIGVDVGGMHISAGIVSEGKILVHKEVDISKVKTRKEFLENLFGLISTLIDNKIKEIGIGFPAPVIDGFIPEVQNMPFLDRINLKKEVEKEFKVRCIVENDANCFILGEQRYGAAKGKKNAVGITLGTGLGCGIIIDNNIYSGSTGSAGEISMIPSKKGKLEEYANARYLVKISGKSPKTLYKLAKKGNKKALECWESFGRNLGNVLTIIVDSLNPEVVVIGGKISLAYPFFRHGLMPQIKKNSFKYTYSKTKIVKAKLKDSAIVGSASLFNK